MYHPIAIPVPDVDQHFHSEMSPSTAHRWRPCPGSVEESRGLPDDVGEEAHQGTVFHENAADCLELGLDPFPMVGSRMVCQDGVEREFTREMASKMLPGLDMLWALADTPGATMHVEKRVNLENWIGPGESGTADCFVINPTLMQLVCFDWKWGAGVPVSPDHNDQAMLYVLGVWDTYAGEEFFNHVWAEYEKAQQDMPDNWPDEIEVTIIIEQPRAPGGGGVWKTTMGDILREGRKIKLDAKKAKRPGAPRVPGEKQCKFCKAARHNTCKVRADYITDLVGMELDEMELDLAVGAEPDLADRRALTPEQRSQIVLHSKLVTDWLSQLHDEVMDELKKGSYVPGLKRVPGRSGARKWKDEDKAEILVVHDFKEKAYTKKLLSPTAVEDEVGKKVYKERFEAFVTQADPKPILVPENDPRPALVTDEELLDEMWDEPEDTENLL